MPEEVLFESEANHSRSEVATYLRQVADSIDGGGPITLKAGGESVTMDPPGTVEFEVKAEREGPTDASGELSVEFELEWDENASGDKADSGSLEIE
jgi:amphi-Trp domain-containing protein